MRASNEIAAVRLASGSASRVFMREKTLARSKTLPLVLFHECRAGGGGFASSIQTRDANQSAKLRFVMGITNRFLDHPRVDYSLCQARAAYWRWPESPAVLRLF